MMMDELASYPENNLEDYIIKKIPESDYSLGMLDFMRNNCLKVNELTAIISKVNYYERIIINHDLNEWGYDLIIKAINLIKEHLKEYPEDELNYIMPDINFMLIPFSYRALRSIAMINKEHFSELFLINIKHYESFDDLLSLKNEHHDLIMRDFIKLKKLMADNIYIKKNHKKMYLDLYHKEFVVKNNKLRFNGYYINLNDKEERLKVSFNRKFYNFFNGLFDEKRLVYYKPVIGSPYKLYEICVYKKKVMLDYLLDYFSKIRLIANKLVNSYREINEEIIKSYKNHNLD